jgi:hypothetical protein
MTEQNDEKLREIAEIIDPVLVGQYDRWHNMEPNFNVPGRVIEDTGARYERLLVKARAILSLLLSDKAALQAELAVAKAETALVIDMHRELALWADHRHSLGDDGILAIQKRARDAEARATASEAERAADRAEVERLRDAVRNARDWFRDYERQHLAKGTPDGNLKADANKRRADEMDAALKETSDAG